MASRQEWVQIAGEVLDFPGTRVGVEKRVWWLRGSPQQGCSGTKVILAGFRNGAKSHLRVMVRIEGPTYGNRRASGPAGRALGKVEGQLGLLAYP